MLDSSSTTKQSGVEEGASGGDGTSDTAEAAFGSDKAAVSAMRLRCEKRNRCRDAARPIGGLKVLIMSFPMPPNAAATGA